MHLAGCGKKGVARTERHSLALDKKPASPGDDNV